MKIHLILSGSDLADVLLMSPYRDAKSKRFFGYGLFCHERNKIFISRYDLTYRRKDMQTLKSQEIFNPSDYNRASKIFAHAILENCSVPSHITLKRLIHSSTFIIDNMVEEKGENNAR